MPSAPIGSPGRTKTDKDKDKDKNYEFTWARWWSWRPPPPDINPECSPYLCVPSKVHARPDSARRSMERPGDTTTRREDAGTPSGVPLISVTPSSTSGRLSAALDHSHLRPQPLPAVLPSSALHRHKSGAQRDRISHPYPALDSLPTGPLDAAAAASDGGSCHGNLKSPSVTGELAWQQPPCSTVPAPVQLGSVTPHTGTPKRVLSSASWVPGPSGIRGVGETASGPRRRRRASLNAVPDDDLELAQLGTSFQSFGLSTQFQGSLRRLDFACRMRQFFGWESTSIQSYNAARAVYDEERHRSRRGVPAGGRFMSALSSHGIWGLYRYLSTSKAAKVALITGDVITDSMLVLLYMVEVAVMHPTVASEIPIPGRVPWWLWIPRPFSIWALAVFLSSINVLSLLIRLAASDSSMVLTRLLHSLVDALTCLPVVISLWIPNGQQLYVPYFLRSIMVIPRLRRIMHIQMELSAVIQPMDPLRDKLVALLATIVAIIFNTTCAFQYAELMFSDTALGLVDSFYVTFVTLSTVGYGDITPKSPQGKIVVMLAIIVSFVALPGLIGSLVETLRFRREGAGNYNARRVPHVVIIGRLDDLRVVTNLLNSFLYNESSLPVKIVFMSRRKPSSDVKALIRTPAFANQVFFVQGSALNEQDLRRAKVAEASAVFFTTDKSAQEDERNVLRAWAVARHAPTMSIYIYVHDAEFVRYHIDHATAIASTCDLKQALLGYNCLHRGAATLITNLVNNITPMESYDAPWQVQYGDGLGHEIYNTPVNPVFSGKLFNQVSTYIYLEFQIMPIGVRLPVTNTSAEFVVHDYHVVLNPGESYRLTGDEELVCIAQGAREIEGLTRLTEEELLRSLETYAQPIFSDHAIVREATLTRAVGEHEISPVDALAQRLPAMLGSPYAIKQPTGPSSDFQKVPLCHVLPHPPAHVEDALVTGHIHQEGHVLVLTSTWNLFRFLCTLRSAHLPSEDLRPIVFVSPSLPSDHEFRPLAQFPLISFMRGNLRSRSDLLRASIDRADRIVILSDETQDKARSPSPGSSGRDSGHAGDFNDLPAIMARHLVSTTLQRRHRDEYTYTMIELQDTEAIRFLSSAVHSRPVAGPRLVMYPGGPSSSYSSGPLDFQQHRPLPGEHPLVKSHTQSHLSSRPISTSPEGDGVDESYSSLGVQTTTSKGHIIPEGTPLAQEPPSFPSTSSKVTRPTRHKAVARPQAPEQSNASASVLRRSSDDKGSHRPGRSSKWAPSLLSRAFKRHEKAGVPKGVHYDPCFASGEAFCSSMLDNILVQHYFNPVALDIVKLFAGVRNLVDLRLERLFELRPSFLYTVDLPQEYVGKPFKDLYKGLALGLGVLPIALYRAPSVDLGNTRSFVYTAPHPEVLLKATDVVFALTKLWQSENAPATVLGSDIAAAPPHTPS